MSKKKKIFLAVMIFLIIGAIGSAFEEEQEPTKQANTASSNAEQQQKPEATLSFKEECKQNAAKYPAKMGSVLYTKGDYKFTGIKYYFDGEILKLSTIENVGDASIWLVKNEHGYVMPIQHYHFKAEVGDNVEVWGTLSGDGFANAEGIDNVVGQTGSMHAMQVTVNGEEQY